MPKMFDIYEWSQTNGFSAKQLFHARTLIAIEENSIPPQFENCKEMVTIYEAILIMNLMSKLSRQDGAEDGNKDSQCGSKP